MRKIDPLEKAAHSERKRSMVNIWVGKQIGPEVEELAAREERATGRTTTKTNFALDLFLWALDRYREAGSLARLKGAAPGRRSKRIAVEVQEAMFTAVQIIIDNAESPVIEEVQDYLSKKADWSRQQAQAFNEKND